jgi:type I restriction enzyme S subunit
LKGLEASILPFSELENLLTIGSEYYLRSFVDDQQRLRSCGFALETLSSACSLITDGDHGVADYQDFGVPFILSENVKDGWIDISDLRKISNTHHKMLKRSQIVPHDVLITKTGVYFGKSAVFDTQLREANTIAHVGVLRPKKHVNPYFLSAFLNGRYGQTQLRRRGIKATRPEIKLVEFQDIELPLLSEAAAQKIESTVLRSKQIRTEVDASVARAAEIVLHALGLASWAPSQPLAYTARASDVFGAGRIDAQFFRPLFSEVADRLQATGRAYKLGSILSVNARGRQPLYDDAGLPVINSKHVRTNRVILEDNRTAKESGSPVIIETGDVLLNGTGVGTIGRAAPYLHQRRALPDNHVTVLRTDAMDPVYLSVFLNSPLGQWQIERHIKGSSGQIELYPVDIGRIMIWDAPDAVQQSVRAAILSAFNEERRAIDLWAAAKRAVEIAIEDGEPAAMAYLDQSEGAI